MVIMCAADILAPKMVAYTVYRITLVECIYFMHFLFI